MRVNKKIWAAYVFTFALTLGLAFLTNSFAKNGEAHKDIVVFKRSTIDHLTGSNIVDVLLGVPLQEKIGHVEWNNARLTVELLVPAEGGRPEAWFNDVKKLINVSFDQLDNVNRLLVRIVERDNSNRKLLAAVDVRQSDNWLDHDLKALSYSNPISDEIWRKRLRISFTNAWEKRFGQAQGYSAQTIHLE